MGIYEKVKGLSLGGVTAVALVALLVTMGKSPIEAVSLVVVAIVAVFITVGVRTGWR